MAEEVTKGEKDFISFVQEAGFVWGPSPEIYGGLAGFYTYGPLGKLLKNKVEKIALQSTEIAMPLYEKLGFSDSREPLLIKSLL